ncbi:MAG: hypothetical protein KIT57_05300 [Blastocatellales bacterium]|nr:hypothetical protein [Blastocatellales bacterium]
MSEYTRKFLIGEWIIDPTDCESIKKYGIVSMKFKENGQLIYRNHFAGETKIMLLTYRIQGDLLITNQPSAPREEQTNYSITPEGKLVLLYGTRASRFIRSAAVT